MFDFGLIPFVEILIQKHFYRFDYSQFQKLARNSAGKSQLFLDISTKKFDRYMIFHIFTKKIVVSKTIAKTNS
jgi:hypothetical protein